ncbi:MAG TPA: prepilin-type N-terminal cleavage/methylation domain-containing protein [Geminicoccaceae bacterium]|nr:prepilin-type N-terminal cleavage/methylation domain-containing protein [Geminicoccaceae bacterium]
MRGRRRVLPSSDGRPAAAAGFTLLEMIVAMGVLSLIGLLLVQGLGFGILARERLEARTVRMQTATLGLELVRRQLSRAQRLVWGTADEARLAFQGRGDRVRFVTAEPAYRPGAALVLWELAVVSSAGDRRLLLRRADHHSGVADFAALDVAEPRELMRVAAPLTFTYYGRLGERDAPRWQDEWTSRERLPLAVRVSDAGAGGSWPELVVRPLIDAAAGCAIPETPASRGCEP